ncbi:MAG: hypothetical protein SNJ66_08715 [Chloroherpetonaceae bacterium]
MKKKLLSIAAGILFGLFISVLFTSITSNDQQVMAAEQKPIDWYYWWCGSPAGNVCCLHW